VDQAGGRFGFVDPNVTAIVDGNEIIDLQLEAGESLRMIVTTAHEGLESIATKGPSSQIEKLERVYSGLRIIQQARKNTLEAESAGLTDEERTAVIVTLKEKLKGDPRAPHLARGAGEARCIGRKGGATFAQIVPPEIRAHAGHTTAPLS